MFEKEKLVENAEKTGEYFIERLNALKEKHADKIKEVRGAGLLIGIELDKSIAKDIFKKLFDDGILTSLCGGTTLRLAPPLIISENEVNLFISELDIILKKVEVANQ